MAAPAVGNRPIERKPSIKRERTQAPDAQKLKAAADRTSPNALTGEALRVTKGAAPDNFQNVVPGAVVGKQVGMGAGPDATRALAGMAGRDGKFGLGGSMSHADAVRAGKAYVGPDATMKKGKGGEIVLEKHARQPNGKMGIERRFRGPMPKRTAYPGVQANFESQTTRKTEFGLERAERQKVVGKQMPTNGHAPIKSVFSTNPQLLNKPGIGAAANALARVRGTIDRRAWTVGQKFENATARPRAAVERGLRSDLARRMGSALEPASRFTQRVAEALPEGVKNVGRGLGAVARRAALPAAALWDGYQVVSADNKAREAVKKTSAWGTAGASSLAAAKTLSPLLAAPIPGARVVYGAAVLGAGIGGYFLGENAAARVYDFFSR